MKKTYAGKQYNITVEYDDTGFFEITATCKESGRFASIADVNEILGELIHPILGENVTLECDDIPVEQISRLAEHIDNYLKDGKWQHLEKAFDKDRADWEWRNANGRYDDDIDE